MKLLSQLCFFLMVFIMKGEASQKNSYLLGIGEKGAKNLDYQHELLKKDSLTQIKKAGLKQGMIVWDIGCGTGSMTEVIASVVGDEGHVYAVDISKEQIEIAKKRIQQAGFKNVTFIVSDIYSLRENNYPKGDIIYSRLLLMHLIDPVEAIRIMSCLLKDQGGIISLQESSINSTINRVADQSTLSEALRQYYWLVTTCGRMNGVDYDIGTKLQNMCEKLNIFSDIEYYISSYNFNDQKQLLLDRYDEFKNKAVEAKLITEEEYSILREKLHSYFNSEELTKMNLKIDQHHLLLKYKGR